MSNYYAIHVFYSRNEGYSIPIMVDESMDDEDIINEADARGLFSEEGDVEVVDTVTKIDEEMYRAMGGKRKVSYKVWVSVEKHVEDERGNDTYADLDDLDSLISLGEFDNVDEAKEMVYMVNLKNGNHSL